MVADAVDEFLPSARGVYVPPFQIGDLVAIAIIGLVFPIAELVQMKDVVGNILALIGILADVVAYFIYIKYAKAVSRAR